MFRSIRESISKVRGKAVPDKLALRYRKIQNILYGVYPDPVQSARITDAGLPESSRGYYIAILSALDGDEFTQGSFADETLAEKHEIILKSLKEKLDYSADTVLTRINRRWCAVIAIREEELSEQDIRNTFVNVQDGLDRMYGFTFRTTISHFLTDISDIPQGYKRLTDLQEFLNAIETNANVVSEEDIDHNNSVLMGGSYIQQIQMLSNTLLLHKYTLVPSMVDVIFDEHVLGLGQYYSMGKNRINAVTSLLSEAILISGAPEEFKQSAIEKINDAGSASELRGVIADVFGQLSRIRTQSNDFVSAACAYINEHLNDPNLSVVSICEHTGVSAQHLTRLFKREKFITIAEYINSMRIDKAKSLLSETSMTVMDITAECGYVSHVTFTRNFKHFVNLTPSEYRQLNKR